MHIEFLGLPGVGKTTVARGVAARLQQRGHRVLLPRDTRPDGRAARLISDVPLLTRYVVRRPREFVESLRLLRLFPRPGLGKLRYLREWSRTAALADQWDEQFPVRIFDEGFYQRILAMAWQSSASPAAVHVAVAGTPTPDGLVILKAPMDDVLARFGQRPRTRAHLATERRLETSRGWEQLLEAFRQVEHAAQALRNRFVIEHVASSTEGVETSCDAISRYIDEHLRAPH